MTWERLVLIAIGACVAAFWWSYRLQITVATWERVEKAVKQAQFQRLP